MNDEIKALIAFYQSVGFMVDHHFKGEYILMTDTLFNAVRVYEDGRVWERNTASGEYTKKPAKKQQGE